MITSSMYWDNSTVIRELFHEHKMPMACMWTCLREWSLSVWNYAHMFIYNICRHLRLYFNPLQLKICLRHYRLPFTIITLSVLDNVLIPYSGSMSYLAWPDGLATYAVRLWWGMTSTLVKWNDILGIETMVLLYLMLISGVCVCFV